MNLPTIAGRRGLLGLLAASPLLAALPALATAHPDADLLDLARQHALAGQAAERLSDVAMSREEAAQATLPAIPAIGADGARREALEAAYVAGGVRQAEALADAAWRVHYDLETQLFATPATTPEGLKAKARVVALVIGEPDGTYEDALTRNLLADLLA
jgi:hypothetical protein